MTDQGWASAPPPPAPKKSRKGSYVIGGLVAIAAVVGFATTSSGSKNSGQSTQATAAAAASPTPNQAFFTDLNGVDPGVVGNYSNSFLLSLGNGACQDFQNGYTVIAVLQDGQSLLAQGTTSLTPGELGGIIGAASRQLCPSFWPLVQQYLQQTGG